jgi:histidinol dehydrogenase
MTQLLTIEIERLIQAKTNLLNDRQLVLTSSDLKSRVEEILNCVKAQGDEALHRYSQSFDGVDISKTGVKVETQEIQDAYRLVSNEQIEALTNLRDKIRDIEATRLRQMSFATDSEHLKISNVCKPIQSVGCYVPGGQASYPSSLLMTTIPAKVAGVPRKHLTKTLVQSFLLLRIYVKSMKSIEWVVHKLLPQWLMEPRRYFLS